MTSILSFKPGKSATWRAGLGVGLGWLAQGAVLFGTAGCYYCPSRGLTHYIENSVRGRCKMRGGGEYYEYLKGLDKDRLIKMLYKTRRVSKPLPFKSHRTIALRIAYDGRGYCGVQHHVGIRSIEEELRTALTLCDLGGDPVFCGRTDAGVSAIAMVVSIVVKSRMESPNRGYSLTEADREEYPYDMMLNERLPADIRATGWAPAPDEFSARYTCKERYYRYYFSLGDLDLARMEEAAAKIKDMTNFYHLSTHSNPKAVYDRTVEELRIERVGCPEECGDTAAERAHGDLVCIHVRAYSFLHNMVRKIAWVLMECGKGREFSLHQVRIAPAESLVFVSAEFPVPLNFVGNRFSETAMAKEYDAARIAHAIASLKFRRYNGDRR